MSKTINKNYKKTILFDFDGVIHSYASGWHGVDIALDKPVDGIKECIDQLKEKYLIYIYSSRCSHLEGLKCIEKYLKEYNIYSDKITNVKTAAYLTIDDRCICFDGNCSLIDKIDNFIPWTKKTKNIKSTYQMDCMQKYNFENMKYDNQVDYMKKCDFDSTYEGKMLLAAISILTTSKFSFYGNEIDGTNKEPGEICKMLNRLCSDMFSDKNIIDGPLSYDNQINKLKDRNNEIVSNFTMDIEERFTNSEKCLFDEVLNNFIEIERLLKQKFGSMNSYEKAMKRILEELKSDKSGGSMYYAWQSNLACIIQDNSNIDHELSNKIACKFLDRLINKDENDNNEI